MSLINSFPTGGKNMASADMTEIVTPKPSSYPRKIKYSTDEQVVGEWIDGSPVYKKTYTNISIPSSDGWVSVDRTLNYGNAVMITATGIMDVGDGCILIPQTQSNRSIYLSLWEQNDGGLSINANNYGAGTATVTVYYTKKT